MAVKFCKLEHFYTHTIIFEAVSADYFHTFVLDSKMGLSSENSCLNVRWVENANQLLSILNCKLDLKVIVA